MNPSQFAATTILPLLARIVLALAFLPQGWNNLMVITEYSGTDAQRLRELGIRGVAAPEPPRPDVSLGALRGELEWSTLQAEPATEPGARGTPRAVPPDAGARPAPRGPEAAPVLTTPPADTLSPLAPLSERGLYRLAL
ncbi:MAG: hypothetical protein JNK53_08095, partial [Phycisphaerae bacterium]|nr:hypothetical protein [Phycisphaerae bacterium]